MARSPIRCIRCTGRTAVTIALACCAALLASPVNAQNRPAAPETSDASVRDFRTPPGELNQALRQLGREADLLLSFASTDVAGLGSQDLACRCSATEALERLLAGTGLEARAQAGGGYVVRPVAASPPSPGSSLPQPGSEGGAQPDARPMVAPAIQLAPVIISASKPRLYDTPDVNACALGIRDKQDLPFSIGSYTADSVENQRARTARCPAQ